MIDHISFASIPVTDLDRAIAFYRDVLGLGVDTDSEYMPSARWVMMRPGDARTKLHFDLVETMPKATKPAIPFISTDVSGDIEKVRAAGGTIDAEPGPAPWDADTTFAMFRDSEGNQILLSSR